MENVNQVGKHTAFSMGYLTSILKPVCISTDSKTRFSVGKGWRSSGSTSSSCIPSINKHRSALEYKVHTGKFM